MRRSWEPGGRACSRALISPKCWGSRGRSPSRGRRLPAVSGGTLFAGGYFTTAGTNLSAYAAMAYLPGSLAIISTNAAFGFSNGAFGFNVIGPSGSNVVIQASTDLQTWIPPQTNLLVSGLFYFSDAQSPANPRRFYRVQLSPINCTFSGNQAGSGGDGGPGLPNLGCSCNTSVGGAGGLRGSGGGIYNLGTMAFTNCTLSGMALR